MRHFGIIGYPLEHSFSARYFTEKFARERVSADYQLYPLTDIRDVQKVTMPLEGYNVTLPYKQAIIPFLTEMDATAQEIGAVNVVRGTKGYNTDWIGFVNSLRPLLNNTDTQALVLGTGGVSKAVQYGLRQMNIDYLLVSRQEQSGGITYSNINKVLLETHTIIINCTPLGMYPHVDTCPDLPYDAIGEQHILFDCVYNPEQTLFLQRGKQQGARIKNGLEMLHLQAEAAWEIWNK